MNFEKYDKQFAPDPCANTARHDVNRPYTKLASYPTNIVVTPLTTDPKSNSQYTKVIILGVNIESKKKISFIIIP